MGLIPYLKIYIETTLSYDPILSPNAFGEGFMHPAPSETLNTPFYKPTLHRPHILPKDHRQYAELPTSDGGKKSVHVCNTSFRALYERHQTTPVCQAVTICGYVKL